METNELLELIMGGSIVLVLFFFAIIIGFIVIYITGMWKLFKKAGKNGWEAIIPYYNIYVLIEIAGLNWWYFLISLSGTILTTIGLAGLSWIATIAGYGVNFFIFWNLAKKMHKNEISIAILGTLFSRIMIPVLGLSKDYQYDSSVKVSPNGPIEDKKTNINNTYTPERFCVGCGQKLKPDSHFCENCGKKVE